MLMQRCTPVRSHTWAVANWRTRRDARRDGDVHRLLKTVVETLKWYAEENVLRSAIWERFKRECIAFSGSAPKSLVALS